MRTLTRWIFLLMLAPLIFSCQHSIPKTDAPPPPQEESPLKRDLAKQGDLLPELGSMEVGPLAAGPVGAKALEWAEAAKKKTDIPETTYSLYGDFKRIGDRGSYESPYFAKRTLLTQEVLMAWLRHDDSRMNRIGDLIWNICEESTWVLPAHDKGPDTIDLFSAETGSLLASTLQLLGDRLPKDIQERIITENRRRIIDLYLANGDKYGWREGRNNWTGVCAGSVGEVFLLQEKDPERLAAAIEMVVASLKRFIEHGFEEDGGCLEGISYWNYGLSHLVIFSEMLRNRTEGAIDLLADPKINRIATYPLAVYLGNGKYASFSDAHEIASVEPSLAARLGDKTGVKALRDLAGSPVQWNLTRVVRNVLWWDGKGADALTTQTIFLPNSSLAKLVGDAKGIPIVVAIKGGCNAEPHNHNDIGSFIVHADGEVFLCDPGGGLYSRDYFSAKRYENIFANSYGHSVPRIDGKLQQTGPQFKGAIRLADENTVELQFAEAYGLPVLKALTRTVSLKEGNIVLADRAVFTDASPIFEEAFVTWHPVEVNGSEARIRADHGILTLHSESGLFEAEPLEKACQENKKKELLTRLRIVYPAEKMVEARITMTYTPMPSGNTK